MLLHQAMFFYQTNIFSVFTLYLATLRGIQATHLLCPMVVHRKWVKYGILCILVQPYHPAWVASSVTLSGPKVTVDDEPAVLGLALGFERRVWVQYLFYFLNRYRFQITHPYSMSPEHGWEGWCCGRGVGMADVSDGAPCDQQEGSCQPWHEHLLRRDQAVLENESALWLSSYISPINQRMGNSTIYSSFLCSIQLSSPIAV